MLNTYTYSFHTYRCRHARRLIKRMLLEKNYDNIDIKSVVDRNLSTRALSNNTFKNTMDNFCVKCFSWVQEFLYRGLIAEKFHNFSM